MANTLIQFFHWYSPNDGTFWKHTAEQAEYLEKLGLTHAWLPPAYKSADGVNGVGYSVYDLFDLGEFDQKGGVRTKYGTKEEYLQAIQALKSKNVKTIADVVINHKCGGDELEMVTIQEVYSDNRNKTAGEPYKKEVYSKFHFPARNGKYSNFVWDFHCFTGIGDHEDYAKFFLVLNEYGVGWEALGNNGNGNFDYLLGADINYRNPFVREEIKKWLEWYHETIGFDGLRFDAVKHYSIEFQNELIDFIKSKNPNLFLMAEYWSYNLEELLAFMKSTDYRVKVMDAPLHANFHKASTSDNSYDLTQIFEGSVLQQQPMHAITFVENHDTQPLQALESPVDYWFKCLGYALILLREDGEPCVFYPHLFGAKYEDDGPDGKKHFIELAGVLGLPEMLMIRKYFPDGMLMDYFDHPNTIGWVKRNEALNTVFGVLMSNGGAGEKRMEFGNAYAGKILVDALNRCTTPVKIDKNGWAVVYTNERSVSVWVLEEMKVKVQI